MQAQSHLLTVGDFMSSPAIMGDSHADLIDAISVMTRRNIGNIVVVEEGEPVGILTERELLQYLNFKKEIPNTLVGKAALRSFTRLTADRCSKDAAGLMAAKRSRLFVFKKDELWQQDKIGGITITITITTASDILWVFLETSRNPSTEDVIRRKVFTLDHDRTILAAVKMMNKRVIGSVIVEKGGAPYGIYTERDLPNNVLPRHMNLEEKVGKYCARPVRTHRLGIDARTAGMGMIANGIKRLPLTYRGKIAGIITARDLVAAF